MNSDAKRFKIFVANRVQLIREHSEPSQWTYIKLKKNPADETSYGLSPSNLELRLSGGLKVQNFCGKRSQDGLN